MPRHTLTVFEKQRCFQNEDLFDDIYSKHTFRVMLTGLITYKTNLNPNLDSLFSGLF